MQSSMKWCERIRALHKSNLDILDDDMIASEIRRERRCSLVPGRPTKHDDQENDDSFCSEDFSLAFYLWWVYMKNLESVEQNNILKGYKMSQLSRRTSLSRMIRCRLHQFSHLKIDLVYYRSVYYKFWG